MVCCGSPPAAFSRVCHDLQRTGGGCCCSDTAPKNGSQCYLHCSIRQVVLQPQVVNCGYFFGMLAETRTVQVELRVASAANDGTPWPKSGPGQLNTHVQGTSGQGELWIWGGATRACQTAPPGDALVIHIWDSDEVLLRVYETRSAWRQASKSEVRGEVRIVPALGMQGELNLPLAKDGRVVGMIGLNVSRSGAGGRIEDEYSEALIDQVSPMFHPDVEGSSKRQARLPSAGVMQTQELTDIRGKSDESKINVGDQDPQPVLEKEPEPSKSPILQAPPAYVEPFKSPFHQPEESILPNPDDLNVGTGAVGGIGVPKAPTSSAPNSSGPTQAIGPPQGFGPGGMTGPNSSNTAPTKAIGPPQGFGPGGMTGPTSGNTPQTKAIGPPQGFGPGGMTGPNSGNAPPTNAIGPPQGFGPGGMTGPKSASTQQTKAIGPPQGFGPGGMTGPKSANTEQTKAIGPPQGFGPGGMTGPKSASTQQTKAIGPPQGFGPGGMTGPSPGSSPPLKASPVSSPPKASPANSHASDPPHAIDA